MDVLILSELVNEEEKSIGLHVFTDIGSENLISCRSFSVFTNISSFFTPLELFPVGKQVFVNVSGSAAITDHYSGM